MKFEEALKLVGLAEGGYSNHPDDKGGETCMGISRVAHPDSEIWEMIDKWKERGNTSPQALTKLAKNDPHFVKLVNGIYRGLYWQSCRCDELPDLWRYPMFSCAVNCGNKTAIRLLQKVVGIAADGIYGRKTTQAVRIYIRKDLFVDKFCDLWSKYYDQIVKNNPKQEVFLRGWKNRIEDVKVENF